MLFTSLLKVLNHLAIDARGKSSEGLGVLKRQLWFGETYDFEIQPERGQQLWLEVRRGNGEWVLQAPIRVR